MFRFLKKNTDSSSSLKRYYLNCRGNRTGPAIFGKRLKNEFKEMGWVYNARSFDYNLAFISGNYCNGKVNVLRLDGLYFDIDDTVGNTDELNIPIRKSYYEFDKIIFQSNFSKEMFFRHFGNIKKPYKVIYNGVPKYFSPIGKKYNYPFDRTIVCSSTWRAHKRLEGIIDGFKELNNSTIGLVILGKCEKIVNHKNIVYLGNVKAHNLPYYLRGADAFVHLTWLDCCPNVVVEALACGLPVLCSHNGGTKELVRDSGIILKLEDDYNFQKVALYSPPKPDPGIVADGIKTLLEWNKPIERADLYIDHVSRQYIDFIT